MGEFADMAVEAMFEEEEYYYNNPDEYEDVVNDFAPSGRRKNTKICRCCGQAGLLWRMTPKGKWMLVESNLKLHNCPKNPYSNKKVYKSKPVAPVKQKSENTIDYTKDPEFWAKANPQALYWYMVDNPEKAKNISEKAGAILNRNLK